MIASVSAPIVKDRYISVISRLLMLGLKGGLKKIAVLATVGIVSPMLARADPSAGFNYFVIDWL